MVEKYEDEGDLFLTFLGYIDKCFVLSDEKAKSLDDCYDWSTVQIMTRKGEIHEEVDALNECVENSFALEGDYDSEN